ncbi:TetR/AcrR family transcriptional regulator [Pseudokineococcus sp. 1T1Z-3]|uniref:TetR/AcrR family transcriptional regulator n=1 Tax=Pseudokineococcus sp. 1T1Z-3 TaxID=3132745 RepID=UPI00309503BD
MRTQEDGRRAPFRPDRREQILLAAEQVLAEEGMAAVSVRAVAERAGLGASTLRYWFPSQDQLVTALARRQLHPHLEDRRISDPGVPAAERLLECLQQFVVTSDPEDLPSALDHWAVMVSLAVGPHATPLGRATYAGFVEAAAERVEGWLAVLVTEGALPAERVSLAVPALLTRVDGLALGMLRPASPLDVGTALDVLREDVAWVLRPPG